MPGRTFTICSLASLALLVTTLAVAWESRDDPRRWLLSGPREGDHLELFSGGGVVSVRRLTPHEPEGPHTSAPWEVRSISLRYGLIVLASTTLPCAWLVIWSKNRQHRPARFPVCTVC